MEGVDFSGSRPSPICMWGQGKRFAGRYFGPGGSWKHATKAEVKALTAVGMSVVVLAEGDEDGALDGRSAGAGHARQAHNAMVAAGIAGTRPIYFAVDFDAQPHQLAKVRAYFDGAAGEIGRNRVGIYAGYDVIEWAAKNGVAKWFFQTYAWSHGRWSRANHWEQYKNRVTVCGGQVDLCRSKAGDFGQWPAPDQEVGQVPAPPGDSTVETPWEFVDYIDDLTSSFSSVASTMDAAAQVMEGLR